MTEGQSKIRRTRILLLGVLFAALALYLPSLKHPFIWDDQAQIVENDVLRSNDALKRLTTSSTFDAGGGELVGAFYRPLVSLINYGNFRVWGLNPAGYRLFQIAVHTLNVLFVFLLVKKIRVRSREQMSEAIALLVAFLFAIHPVNVESVVYIAAVGEVVYTALGLLALLGLIRFIELKQGRLSYFAQLLPFFILSLSSMLAKESGIIFILIGALYIGIFTSQRAKLLHRYVIGSLLTVLAYLWFRLVIAGLPFLINYNSSISNAGLPYRLLTVPYVIARYIMTLIAPIWLVIYENTVVPSPRNIYFWGSAALLLALAIGSALWYRRTRSKSFLFFSLMFVISLLPVLNIYGLDMTTADRWLYVPAIGFWGAILIVLFSATQGKRRLRSILISGLVLLSVLYGARSLARQQNWSSGYALFGHDIQYVRGSFELMDNYAAELIKRGEYAEAIPYLEESIRLNPHWYRTRTNLGVAYQFLGEDKKAEAVYLDTILNYPTPFAYGNLTTLYYNRGDYATAEDVIHDGLELYPNFNRLHFLRALVFIKTDRRDEALKIMQELLDKQALDRDIREFILQLDTVTQAQ